MPQKLLTSFPPPQVVNSATNAAVYCALSPRFRREFSDTFAPLRRRLSEGWRRAVERARGTHGKEEEEEGPGLKVVVEEEEEERKEGRRKSSASSV